MVLPPDEFGVGEQPSCPMCGTVMLDAEDTQLTRTGARCGTRPSESKLRLLVVEIQLVVLTHAWEVAEAKSDPR